MVAESLVVVVGVVVAVVVSVIGGLIGRAKGGKSGFQAATAAEERARDQARAHANDTALLQERNQQLLELIVNLPETVNKMGAVRSTSAFCRITV